MAGGFLSLFRCDAKLAVTTLPSIEVELRLKRPSLSHTFVASAEVWLPLEIEITFLSLVAGEDVPSPAAVPLRSAPNPNKTTRSRRSASELEETQPMFPDLELFLGFASFQLRN